MDTYSCSSGTAALHLALLAGGVGRGHEVILPSLTFGTAASVVLAVGATPVFVDVNDRGCLDPLLVKDKLTNKTAAIIPVHLYGETAYVDYDRCTIEDSCEAFGIVPPTADFTCYSFYANKVMTTGEGGAIIGNEIVKQFRDGGFDSEYRFTTPGLNYRMTAMQAALGCGQLERIEALLAKRSACVEYYKKRIRGFGKWLYVFLTTDPRRMISELAKDGIESRRVFTPLHLSPAFEQKGDFPKSEFLYRHGVCLPTDITIKEAERVCDRIATVSPVDDAVGPSASDIPNRDLQTLSVSRAVP